MDKHWIAAAVLNDRSKANVVKIARKIGNSKSDYAALWDMVVHGEDPLPQRAAWIMEHVMILNPQLFGTILEEAVDELEIAQHQAIQRSLTKLLSQTTIPSHLMGRITNRCFELLMDSNITIAVKVYSMQILYHIVLQEPGLKEELETVIEDLMKQESAGLRSRGSRLLKLLKQVNDQQVID